MGIHSDHGGDHGGDLGIAKAQRRCEPVQPVAYNRREEPEL
jgi:hypothetical protein